MEKCSFEGTKMMEKCSFEVLFRNFPAEHRYGQQLGHNADNGHEYKTLVVEHAEEPTA